MRRFLSWWFLALAVPFSATAQEGGSRALPRPFVEPLHGVEVSDPWRWLEDGAAEDTKKWVGLQNEVTRGALDGWPHREALREELARTADLGGVGVPRVRAEQLFYTRREPGQDQAALCVRVGLDGDERVLFDPNTLSASGIVSLDYWSPSPEGTWVAYGVSEGGSEQAVLHVLATADGADSGLSIDGARHSSIAWLKDESGFYYTRMPWSGEVPEGEEGYHQKICFHRLGENSSEDRTLHEADPKEERFGVTIGEDGEHLTISHFRGWSNSFLEVLALPDESAIGTFGAEWNANTSGIVHRGTLYCRTNHEAPRGRLLRWALDAEAPEEIVAESKAMLGGFDLGGDQLAVISLERATSRVRLHGLDGEMREEVRLPGLGSASGVHLDAGGGALWMGFSSFVDPGRVLRHVPGSGEEPAIWARTEAPQDPANYVVEQVEAPSKDGTPIPLFLVRHKDTKKDGRRPTILNGYGGFNVSLTPRYAGSDVSFLDRGGLVVTANLRGGGELGEEWHEAGMLANKQNVFDDFHGAARWLCSSGWTHPGRLAIQGGSNGGLLVAVAAMQSPTSYRAVLCAVPLTDMLRYHLFSIARLWIPEYGDPDKPEDFEWLYAYSPYHRVRPGVYYPAMLITAGVNDSRVDPLHARKFAAAVQDANVSNLPILLRIDGDAGHGQGKPVARRLDEAVDRWAFLFTQLEVEWELEAPPASAASDG